MNTRTALDELRNARLDFLAARLRYLAAARRVEKKIYRTDRPTLLRKQA